MFQLLIFFSFDFWLDEILIIGFDFWLDDNEDCNKKKRVEGRKSFCSRIVFDLMK